MDEPETWRWIWLVAAAAFATGEILTTGFFLLPFAIGAVVAAVCAFADVDVGIQWVAFVGVSTAGFLALRPLARRLDASTPTEGIGSRRLIGERATVLDTIPAGPGSSGRVRVHREEWWAESAGATEVSEGAEVRITEVRGTRVVVSPLESPEGSDS
jgi:membrane protein implicated in regulation of membrane protease activity